MLPFQLYITITFDILIAQKIYSKSLQFKSKLMLEQTKSYLSEFITNVNEIKRKTDKYIKFI